MASEKREGAAVFALDRGGGIVHANEAARGLLGEPQRSLEDETLWERLPDPGRDRIQTACEQALETGETIELEVPWRQGDRWYHVQTFPIEDNISVHLRDVTDERRAQDELQLRERSLREACETITDPEAGPRERIKRLLTSIRGTLGTEFATLSYVNPEEDAYHFDAVGGDNEEALPEGETIPLDELPVCSRVAQAEQTLVLRDVEEQAPDLVDPRWGISAYIGSPVHAGGEVYGTFCFYSTERRSEDFTDWETTYVELFSDFASAELDRLAADAVTIDPPMVSQPPSV